MTTQVIRKLKVDLTPSSIGQACPMHPTGNSIPGSCSSMARTILILQAYAYSVDDAIGNMQVPGDWSYHCRRRSSRITVLSQPGLPADPSGVWIWAKDRVQFTKYGACTTTPDTGLSTRRLPLSPSTRSKTARSALSTTSITFITSLSRRRRPIPRCLRPSHRPQRTMRPSTAAIMRQEGAAWCHTVLPGNVLVGVFAHSILGVGGANTDTNYVIAPAPNQAIQ